MLVYIICRSRLPAYTHILLHERRSLRERQDARRHIKRSVLGKNLNTST